ncbi:protein mono-ADP-ribosyltransferase PARP12 isoform X2 [Scomber japonicus]|uniref:protein mono-ADP-ribosyltransferase PARP12 isoform X2 n=1 Tax=Scomber japonicus TaxID=13676 RepID=UPI002304E628|nr:protein mono-ADP-ribosyltransferase PARP12 isoform X2 [Scomber japonicus]
MTARVSKFIVQTLCENEGCLDFKSLKDEIAQTFTVAEPLLKQVLFDDGIIAIREVRRSVSGSGHIISPDSLVVAKTSLRICQKKPGECQQCDSLHLCRYFVCGDCTFGHKCKNPHSLALPYNAELLGRWGLHNLTEKQLFQLLLQNDPYLLPEICPHYNKGNGLHGSCRFTTSCTKLHVCLHHLQGDCKFGSDCKRAHNIDAQGMKIFRGFSQENIANLLKIYRNKFIIMGQQGRKPSAVAALPEVKGPVQQLSQKPSQSKPTSPTSLTSPTPLASSAGAPKTISDAERDEICLFFIRKHCSFKDKCARVHWDSPYRWQVLERDMTWKDLLNMEDIEKAYCDPGQDTSCTDQAASPTLGGIFRLLSFQSPAPPAVQSVDFMTMTYKGSPVRRLSTASSVTKPPHFILTTKWLWYWKDENGKWQEFGQGDTQASTTSQTLENVYLADKDAQIHFSAGRQQYVLNFKGATGTPPMYQQNIKYHTQREVRRRPLFVSAQDVEAQLKSAPSLSSSTADSVPSYWDKSALPDFGYKLVPLPQSNEYYKMIAMLFRSTMPKSKINSIKRIQNPSLWKVFQWQREQMKLRSGGKPVEEKYLFHGTDDSLLEAICEQNFDWRMCGVHGTAYGKGSYFAKDASYSDRYAGIKGNRHKIMFVALVLVGEYTKGTSSYVRPPPKGNSRTFYDSCVNCTSNPGIFVIFEKQQIYPEYIIDYS